MKRDDYLDPDRLGDVLALIQVLAQAADDTVRSESGLTKELQGKPKSKGACTWVELADIHREFFRVERDPVRVSLIWRYVLARDERGKRASLTPEITAKLLELAISIHDRQAQRRQRFNYIWAILLAGLIAGLFQLLGIWLNASRPTG